MIYYKLFKTFTQAKASILFQQHPNTNEVHPQRVNLHLGRKGREHHHFNDPCWSRWRHLSKTEIKITLPQVQATTGRKRGEDEGWFYEAEGRKDETVRVDNGEEEFEKTEKEGDAEAKTEKDQTAQENRRGR